MNSTDAQPHALRWTVLALLMWAVLSAGAVARVAHVQGGARHGVEQRFALRATIASRFVTTYVRDLARRQTVDANRHLRATSISNRAFVATARDSGFRAALLLDRQGRVLQSLPADPDLVGTDLTAKYAHLRSAVAGHVAISKVVLSVVEGLPVVAFAVPFDTPGGRRVYSGAYDIGRTPAGAYLRNAIPIPRSRVYLIDSAGIVIAKNGEKLAGVQSLAALEPDLAVDAARHSEGSVRADGVDTRYASARIAGTPWRVVVTAPAGALYQSTSGAASWLPWAALIGFIVMSLVALLVGLRYLRGRTELARLIVLLETVVRVDPLTDVYNRRGLDEHLEQAAGRARRHRHPLTVMLIDVDHFKQANDRWGHQAGDAILAELAGFMKRALRVEDVLGRWGGEEFLVILPDTGADAALILANRLRAAIADLEIELGDGTIASVTVSIGLASSIEDGPEARIGRADKALYAAKASGRNRVEVGRRESAVPVA